MGLDMAPFTSLQYLQPSEGLSRRHHQLRVAAFCLWKAYPSQSCSVQCYIGLPTGLLQEQGLTLRQTVVGICISVSSTFRPDMVWVTICLTATSYLYNKCGLARHPVEKNFCAIWGYISFETGAIKIIGRYVLLYQITHKPMIHRFKQRPRQSFSLSGGSEWTCYLHNNSLARFS